MSEPVSERKQDSSSQTTPVEDESDPPEGSEEAVESCRTNMPKGKGGRLLGFWRGHGLGQVGAGSVMETDLGSRALGTGGAQAPSLGASLCSTRHPQSLFCPPFQTKAPHPAQMTS